MKKKSDDLNALYDRLVKEERRRLHAENGLCVQCGKNPPKTGNKLCIQCLKIRRDNAKRIYDERKAAGICVECGSAPARSGRIWCAECAEKIYRKRKEEASNGI